MSWDPNGSGTASGTTKNSKSSRSKANALAQVESTTTIGQPEHMIPKAFNMGPLRSSDRKDMGMGSADLDTNGDLENQKIGDEMSL